MDILDIQRLSDWIHRQMTPPSLLMPGLRKTTPLYLRSYLTRQTSRFANEARCLVPAGRPAIALKNCGAPTEFRPK